MFLILPIFIIISSILLYGIAVIGRDIVFAIIYGIIIFIVGIELVKSGLHTPQDHFKQLSRNTVDIERVEFQFDDGVKSVGLFYRSIQQTIETPEGRRYPEPRPAIIFFHGFMSKKEVNEKYLIPLAHLGYVTFAFDQRGHGEAGRGRNDRLQLIKDALPVIDLVCGATDVKPNHICCIGISLGGATVLTTCYADPRVAMVIGMSTFHSIAAFGKIKFNPFSIGKLFQWIMVKTSKKDRHPKITPNYYLKKDPIFNRNRLFLIHGAKDIYFPPELTFELNKQQAGIPEDHALLLENAEHGLDNQELLILAAFIKWLNENEAMTLK